MVFRVAILHTLDLHYETLTVFLMCLHHTIPTAQLAKVEWVLYCNMIGPEFHWWSDWWRGEMCKLAAINIQPFDRFLQVSGFENEFDMIVLDTDDEPIGQMIDPSRCWVLNHTPTMRCPLAPYQFDIRHFGEMLTPRTQNPVAIPCFPFVDALPQIPRPPIRANTLVVIGAGDAMDWPVVRLLGTHVDINIITRRQTVGQIPDDVRALPRVRIVQDAPTQAMIQILCSARALLIPKKGAYVHSRFPGSLTLALSLGVPIIMPYLMAYQILRHELLTLSQGRAIFTYDLTPEAIAALPFVDDATSPDDQPTERTVAQTLSMLPCGRNAFGAYRLIEHHPPEDLRQATDEVCRTIFQSSLFPGFATVLMERLAQSPHLTHEG